MTSFVFKLHKRTRLTPRLSVLQFDYIESVDMVYMLWLDNYKIELQEQKKGSD